jgi:hypothetical protein
VINVLSGYLHERRGSVTGDGTCGHSPYSLLIVTPNLKCFCCPSIVHRWLELIEKVTTLNCTCRQRCVRWGNVTWVVEGQLRQDNGCVSIGL